MGVTGILSGHGGVVTGVFHERVSEAVLRDSLGNDEDFPATITTNIARGAIDNAGIVDLTRFRALLEETLPVFSGTEELLMLCNSFYAYADEITSRYGGRLVSIPALVRERIADPRETLVLASHTVRDARLYGDEVTYAEDPEVDELIALGIRSEGARPLIQALRARHGEARAVVLGCTDLALYRNNFAGIWNVPVFDSVTIAAEYLVNKMRENDR